MAYKYTSEKHLLSLEFHLVRSVIYFIEVHHRRTSPFVFTFKAFVILARCLLVYCTEEVLVCSTLSESILIIVFSALSCLQKPS